MRSDLANLYSKDDASHWQMLHPCINVDAVRPSTSNGFVGTFLVLCHLFVHWRCVWISKREENIYNISWGEHRGRLRTLLYWALYLLLKSRSPVIGSNREELSRTKVVTWIGAYAVFSYLISKVKGLVCKLHVCLKCHYKTDIPFFFHLWDKLSTQGWI